MSAPREIRVWLAGQGMTQRQLADLAGIRYRQLTRALQTGRATPVVREAIRDLTGVELEAAGRVLWTTEDDQFLLEHAGLPHHASMAEIASRLGRSVGSCQSRLHRLRSRKKSRPTP